MTTDLHLFSAAGRDFGDMEWIVEACRPYLAARRDAKLACLPLASLYTEKEIEQVQRAFAGLARVEAINAEAMQLPEMEAILRSATVAYIPGGNTFLLSHRLHISRLFPSLRKKLEAGLPLIGVSAGTVLCGPNILTSNDINMLPTTHFDGLNLTPFNFNVHYADDAWKDLQLSDYQAFHDNPLLLMEDGAYIRVRGKKTELVRGEAWIWRAGRDKARLTAGENIIPYLEAQRG